jgi:ABC-type Fe3+/spermidine/putrescine transport system ATPase subunit
MRLELSALQKRLNLAVVYVTHDQDEALAMSDRIAVLNKGQVEQVGSPSELYEHPRTRFVSDFLGRTIVVSGTVRRDGADGFVVVRDSGSVSLPGGRGHEFSQGQEVRVLCRPEDITVLPATACGPNQVTGQVGRVAYMGSHLEYTISTAGSCLQVPAGKRDLYAVGATVRLQFDPASITVLAQ